MSGNILLFAGRSSVEREVRSTASNYKESKSEFSELRSEFSSSRSEMLSSASHTSGISFM
jgi:hypothetical protein